MVADSRKRQLAYAGISMVILVTAAMWVYVFFIADIKPTDKLASNTFPKAAEPVCARTVQKLKDDGLVLKKADTPLERAALVDQADDALKAMVDQLKALAPTTGADATTISKWLGDWQVWFSDRDKWAASLRAGNGGPFNETQRSTGEPNSQALSTLAVNNDMPDCQIPYAV